VKATQETEIGGITYQVTMLPGMTGLRFFAKLGRLLSPALGQLKSLGELGDLEKLKLGEVQIGQLAPVFASLFERLTEEEMVSIANTLLESAQYIDTDKMGQKVILPLRSAMNTHFQGKTFRLLKLIFFALKVNFADFSEALADAGSTSGDQTAASA
jgi:hypothetical protein